MKDRKKKMKEVCKKESVRDCVWTKKKKINMYLCVLQHIYTFCGPVRVWVCVHVCGCVPVTGTSASSMSREPSQTSLLKPCSSSSNKNLKRFPPSELNSL